MRTPYRSNLRTVTRVNVVMYAGLLLGLAACAETSGGQSTDEGPWFGLTLPPPVTPHEPEVIIDGREPAPAVVPAGEEAFTALAGDRIRVDLEAIVAFAIESRETGEIGEGQLWGRVTGLESGDRTVDWAIQQLREAGIEDVERQEFEQDDDATLTLPVSWEVRLVADPAFGAGSDDVVLESAMPISSAAIPEELNAPLVYVGTATPAELANVDLTGKVAVQRIIPQGHTVFNRNPAGPRAAALLERGAVAVLNVVDLPGNMRSRDMGCGEGPCFNIGGRDGLFLESVMSHAAEGGILDRVQVSMRAEYEQLTGLTAANGVAIIPGTSDETIIVNAHADAWFDGAGDNGDGLAVMLALARHFVQPDHRPERTIVFVASAGHHSSGLSGPGHFVEMNPELVARAVLAINLEHVALREIAPARSEFPDGYREWVADSYEAPIVAGLTNEAPFLESLVEEGIQRYGTNFVSGPNTMASGEGGSYVRAGLPVFTTMQGSPLYHTSGEVAEVVSEPGLERMARFMAFFIREVGDADADRIDPS